MGKIFPIPFYLLNMKKRKGKSIFDKVVAWIHLWPSIVSGIIVVFVCLTGTLIVYTDEIMEFSAGDARFVTPHTERIGQDDIFQNISAVNPDYHISEIVFYKDPKRSLRLRVFDTKKMDLVMIYMDPYTGKILKEDGTIYFFFIMAHLHAELLAGPVGSWTVLISTIIFVLSCITGIILWWPKKWNKTTREASFTIKWKAKFKRLNYDLHNVLGFYSLLVCTVLGMTGLIIFFHPLMDLTVKISGGDGIGLQQGLPRADNTQVSLDMVPMAYRTMEEVYPEKRAVNIWVYQLDQLGAYAFGSGNPGLKSIEHADFTVYDRYTGYKLDLPQGQLLHEKTENMVWQLHMGQWWGAFGKLTTFLAGIVATSLPITGFIIWWGRRKKKRAKPQQGAALGT